MQITVEEIDQKVTFKLNGRFDFNVSHNFRNSYNPILKRLENIEMIYVDLAEVDYMDTSALGMLLLLREEVQLANININIINSCSIVRKTLEIAHFDRLFTVI